MLTRSTEVLYFVGFVVIDLMAVSGLVLFLLGSVLILTEAFRKSKLWGLGCLFLGPLMGLVFTFLNWNKAKIPTAMWITGLVLVLLVFFKQQLATQSGIVL
ncbi:hypothetical protein [Vibrio nigripulchritudo]|uniref:hypothetical protein n=1 Tax=Vibrio nigripulchritudo TaxID=28173 RepID=UPI0003B2065A|nr:hypothetical protein [Vibrio nigripulchritudo]CCN68259.1 hypothetical protein VIBNISFn118_10023 [Vibrio nigripulchritudo SFn118]